MRIRLELPAAALVGEARKASFGGILSARLAALYCGKFKFSALT